MTRFLEGTPAALRQQSVRIGARYDAEQRAARGLRADQALDTRAGAPVPYAERVTRPENGYAPVLVSDDGEIAALPLDDYALSQQGRGGVDVRGHRDERELDARVRDRVRAPADANVRASARAGTPR